MSSARARVAFCSVCVALCFLVCVFLSLNILYKNMYMFVVRRAEECGGAGRCRRLPVSDQLSVRKFLCVSILKQ